MVGRCVANGGNRRVEQPVKITNQFNQRWNSNQNRRKARYAEQVLLVNARRSPSRPVRPTGVASTGIAGVKPGGPV